MIRALAFSVLTTAAPQPVGVTVHLSPTQTCQATAAQFDLTATSTGLTITGLACAGDLVFANNFEVTK